MRAQDYWLQRLSVLLDRADRLGSHDWTCNIKDTLEEFYDEYGMTADCEGCRLFSFTKPSRVDSAGQEDTLRLCASCRGEDIEPAEGWPAREKAACPNPISPGLPQPLAVLTPLSIPMCPTRTTPKEGT